MNRRSFLKLGAFSGLAALLPAKLFVNVVEEDIAHQEWNNDGVLTDSDINREMLKTFHNNLKFTKTISNQYSRMK